HRPEETVYQACGQLRLNLAQKFNDRHKLLDPKSLQFLWVVDFPMFEWDEEEKRWNAAHHPFTSVHDEDIEKLTADPARCRAKSYDLVLNGTELGSGSIRIHRRDVQSKVFSAPVTLKADVAGLSAGDRKALAKLVEAAKILNFVFMDQLWQGNRALYEKLKLDTTPLGKERLHYFWLNKGPWSDLDDHTAFLPD